MSSLQKVFSIAPVDRISFRGLVICLLAAFFYLYEYTLQVSPGVMTDSLMRDFSIQASELGVASALYFYSYTPTQLTAGLLYDHYGPRILLTLAIIGCALGAALFSLAPFVWVLAVGRFAMGLGSAFAFIGSLVLISRWFPPRHFAWIGGVVQTLSSVGAIMGAMPLARAVELLGWRASMLGLSAVGFTLAGLVWLVVRDSPYGRLPPVQLNVTQHVWTQMKQFSLNRQNLWNAAYAFCSWAPIASFATLWSIPYLRVRYGVSIDTASAASALIWVGLGIGAPAIGWFSERLQLRNPPLVVASVIGLITTAIFYLPGLPQAGMWFALFCLGLAGSGQALTFAIAKDINSPQIIGTALGFNNMATVLGGALFQPLMGILLSWVWDGTMREQLPVYRLSDFHKCMWILPMCYLGGVLISYFKLRETHCRAIP